MSTQSDIDGYWAPSERQQKVLEYIALGYTIPTTAKRMYVTVNTVKEHLKVMRLRADVGNNPALVHEAWKRGWLDESVI